MATANEISLALVGVTFFLALATLCMAKMTRDLVVQEKRHHREGLMPICEFDITTDAIRPVLCYGEDRDLDPPAPFFALMIPRLGKADPVNIRNIGLGPALQLKLGVSIHANHGLREPAPEIPYAYVDDRAPNTACVAPRIYVPDGISADLRALIESSESQDSYTVWLEYTDVFDTPYHTRLQWTLREPANLFQVGPRKEGP